MSDNKVVLVTGSSRGIGSMCIKEFASKGYNVVINYNNSRKKAFELEKYIKDNFNIDVLTLKCDVSNEEEVKIMINNIIRTFGRLDVVVNNAAIEINSNFEEKSIEKFKKLLDVNLIGIFLVSKYASTHMIKNKFGKIINITSNNAIDKYDPNTLEYDASKAALISLTHNLSKQFSPYINVNAVAPGWVKTETIIELDKQLNDEFIKEEQENIFLKRFGEMEEISKVVSFLASEDASYINNEIIRVDGGVY